MKMQACFFTIKIFTGYVYNITRDYGTNIKPKHTTDGMQALHSNSTHTNSLQYDTIVCI